MASSVFSILLPLSVLCRLLIPRHARVGVSGISVLSYRYTFFKNGSYHCLSVKPQAVRNFTRFLLPPVFKNFFKTILICSSVLLSTFCVVQPSPQSSFKIFSSPLKEALYLLSSLFPCLHPQYFFFMIFDVLTSLGHLASWGEAAPHRASQFL